MATQKQLAAHLGLSDRQVRRHIENGVIPKAEGRGGYDLDDCRLLYIEYLRALASGHAADPNSDYAEQRARYARLKAEKLELDLAINRKEFVHYELLSECLVRVIKPWVHQFDMFTARIKQQFPNVSSRDRRKIVDFLNELRNAVADTQPDWETPADTLSKELRR